LVKVGDKMGMGHLLEHDAYKKDVRYVADLDFPWDILQDRKILIAGAGGLIGSFIIDVLMLKNRENGLHCKLYAMGRNEEAAKNRFSGYWEDANFQFIPHDICTSLEEITDEDFDYIFQLASYTHPVAYATYPVATIMTNVVGTDHLLQYAADHHIRRFVFASSNEIYGENRGDVEFFEETYCGYIDSNTLRAGYPESKRCGEALCQAYIREKGIDAVIPRFTRSYGPTMLMTDTKAISQFIRKGIAGEDIVLKSEGTQYYSYTYVADAVAGAFTVLFYGQSGEAYNIADIGSDIMLKDLAQMIAEICHTKVVFELPDAVEKAGYSTATKARLDGSKVKWLGWIMRYDIRAGLEHTIRILKDCRDDVVS